MHTYYQTKGGGSLQEELFTASGRTEIDLGWKALYTSKKNNEADNEGGPG